MEYQTTIQQNQKKSYKELGATERKEKGESGVATSTR